MAKAAKFYGTGRRKSSVARVYLVPGSGKITVNKKSLDDYFGLETLKVIVKQPLVATGAESKYDVLVNVYGGGFTGQAGAIRHGIARALLTVSADFRPTLKAAGYLTRDQEVRSQSSSSCSSVLKEIIFRDSKRIYKPQKLSVSGVFILSIIVFSCGETQKILYRKQRVNSR